MSHSVDLLCIAESHNVSLLCPSVGIFTVVVVVAVVFDTCLLELIKGLTGQARRKETTTYLQMLPQLPTSLNDGQASKPKAWKKSKERDRIVLTGEPHQPICDVP